MNRISLIYGSLIILLLCAMPVPVKAKANKSLNKPAILDKDKWQEISKQVNYTETYKERKPGKQKPQKGNKINNLHHFNFSRFRDIVKIILIVLIIGVLAYIIYLILNHFFNFFEEKVSDIDIIRHVDNLEADIHGNDIDRLLSVALEKGEFKLAVRILYLKTIKVLTDAELITWKKDKTNARYVTELFNHPLGKHFAFLTLIYEKAWYSDYKIDNGRFEIISTQFNQFLNKIN